MNKNFSSDKVFVGSKVLLLFKGIVFKEVNADVPIKHAFLFLSQIQM